MSPKNSRTKKFAFDVAFSFAGEQRSYVKDTVRALKNKKVSVFYDEDETVNLWGKDLYQYLSDLYQNKARFCVVFLSKQYADKKWTNHELKSAQARAFQESREYILPARFDNTTIPGLLPTIGYINLQNKTPEDFAKLIEQKIANKTIKKSKKFNGFDRNLEWRLANAVIMVEDYLQPQPLRIADPIAMNIRRCFRISGMSPTQDSLIPYLQNKNAAYRVVGYIAFHVKPIRELLPELIICLSHEKLYASQCKDTRPLWQLLVCFTKILKLPLDKQSKKTISDALRDHQNFLQSNNSIDRGGHCKRRIASLISQSSYS